MECYHLIRSRLSMKALCVLTVLLVVMDAAMCRPDAGSNAVNQSLPLGSEESEVLILDNGDDTGDGNMSGHLDDKKNVKRSTDGKFRAAYTSFYEALKTFCSKINSAIKPGSPSALKNIPAVTKIIVPTDLVGGKYSNGKVVIKYLNLTFIATKEILKKVGKFVKQVSQPWFVIQKVSLMVKLSYLEELFGKLSSDTDVVSAGLGGINSGSSFSVNIKALQQLKELFAVLKSQQR